jgi:hypothetical protein
MFAKSADQNYTTDIIRIIKVTNRIPPPVYELEDLNNKMIDGHFISKNWPPCVSQSAALSK